MSVTMTPQEQKRIKAQNLRFKKSALDTLSYEAIASELYEITSFCEDIRYVTDSEGAEKILQNLEGDDEDFYEFQMMFSDLTYKAETLLEAINENPCEDFDDCTVALVGRDQRVMGYDSVEEDYFALTAYESDLAETEAGKRICRKTKADLVATIGQCMGTVLAFLDLRQQFDYLHATLEILMGESAAILKKMKQIDELYVEAEKNCFHKDHFATKKLDRLLAEMPDRFWIE